MAIIVITIPGANTMTPLDDQADDIDIGDMDKRMVLVGVMLNPYILVEIVTF